MGFTCVPGIFGVNANNQTKFFTLKPSHVGGHIFKWLRRSSGLAFSNSGKLAFFQNG